LNICCFLNHYLQPVCYHSSTTISVSVYFFLQFVVNPDWRVVAGEESREKENQKARENRVLEAVYPRLSAIPPR